MHELSLSYATVELVLESIANCGAKRVKTVSVVAGELSGVAVEAFRFSFTIAAEGTMLDGCDLQLEVEPVTVFCPDCNAIGKLESIYSFRCPTCGTPTATSGLARTFCFGRLKLRLTRQPPHEYPHC